MKKTWIEGIADPSGDKNMYGFRLSDFRGRIAPIPSQAEVSRRLKRHGVLLSQTVVARIETGRRHLLDYEFAAFLRVYGITSRHFLSPLRKYGRIVKRKVLRLPD